jgi:glycosyltransferase involved in cell wall biosynthesis
MLVSERSLFDRFTNSFKYKTPLNQESELQKVALFIHKIDTYGVGRIYLNLAKSFVVAGWDVDLVVSEDSGEHQSILSDRMRIVLLKTPRLASSLSWKGVLEFSQYLKTVKPTAVLSFLHYNNEIAILAKYLSGEPVKVVVTDHSILSKTTAAATRKSRKLIPLIARFLYPFADDIIAVSQSVKEDLVALLGIEPSRIQVIYNPIIESDLIQKSQENIAHPWFMEKDRPIILAVGRLAPEKDFSTLIHAFAEVRRHHSARLIILGDPAKHNDKQTLVDLVAQLGLAEDVLFQGFTDNPYAYMAKSDVLVVSSQWEGLSNVVIESFALNLPIVSTCCGGPVELLDYGNYGILVPVGDVLAMAKGISAALSDHKAQVPEEWLEQFTKPVVASRYLDLLTSPSPTQKKTISTSV